MSFKTVQISYIYSEPDVWPLYLQAIEVAGWRKSIILTQIVQTYGKVNLAYYQKAAELDAIARGFEHHQGTHYQMLANWQDLPAYKGNRPQFGSSPLETIPDPDTKSDYVKRQSFGQFRCSERNSVVLHLAMLIERQNIQIVMTRMMRWYYARYWHLYGPQLAAAEQQTINPQLAVKSGAGQRGPFLGDTQDKDS